MVCGWGSAASESWAASDDVRSAWRCTSICLHGTTVLFRSVCSVRHQPSALQVLESSRVGRLPLLPQLHGPPSLSSSQKVLIQSDKSCLLCNPNVHHRIHNSPSNFFKIHFIIIHRRPFLSSDIFSCCVSIRAI